MINARRRLDMHGRVCSVVADVGGPAQQLKALEDFAYRYYVVLNLAPLRLEFPRTLAQLR